MSGRRGPGRAASSARHPQRGATLAIVLGIGVVLAVTLALVALRSGRSRVDTVKNMQATREFYIADAGFNFIKTRVTEANRQGGAEKVRSLMAAQQEAGWQKIGFGTENMGSFRLLSYQVTDLPMSVEMRVQGTADPARPKDRYESVQGLLRAPSLAKYARLVEGASTLVYTGGNDVDGEVLAAGNIDLAGSNTHFRRLISAGQTVKNRQNGIFDFGFREARADIPTLNGVHVNPWDNYAYSAELSASTFEAYARDGGIEAMGDDPYSGNPSWRGLNSSGKCRSTGPCDTLFAGCYDTLSLTRRSPVAVAGSAIHVDLAKILIKGAEVEVTLEPVIHDAGGDGGDYIVLGSPARVYRRPLASFKSNPVIYFPGDIYVEGKLKGISVTLASGDDVFLAGDFVGPEKTETDAGRMPVTLGIVAQDRVYIHESSSRNLTIRAAILAENDEIVYDDRLGVPDWRFGYVCKREIFDPSHAPAAGTAPDLAGYFRDNYIWDDNRVAQAGFGREPEEECRKDGTCPNTALGEYGFAALGYPRKGGGKWRLAFEGSLITRNAGSKGPRDDCDKGWDCDRDPGRVVWSYDDNLGVAYPPRFPAPVVDDRNPTLIVGYKRKSFN